MLAVPMAAMARRRVVKALWYAYPVLVSWVVVVTGNHWWFDAAAGAAVAAVSGLAAVGFARTRPAAWSWTPATTPAPG
jgi:membrane-associated phospholipid phosphatase